MAFRFEKAIGTFLIAAFAVAGQEAEVRHRHLLYGGCTGTLKITEDGVAFQATQKTKHAFTWKWRDIQELELGRDRMAVLTYEDNKWNSARDREYTFDKLPTDFVAEVRVPLRRHLPGRFIDTGVSPVSSTWEIPVKLRQAAWRGANGVLRVSPGGVQFRASKGSASRTWSIADIQSVASSGPYDLALTTLEKSGVTRASGREFRFQLKEPLDPARYQQLWDAVERGKGLQVLSSYKGDNK
jgi:hypothetical protein